GQDVVGLCKDDGCRMSVCLALVRVAPELTLQHPLDVQQDLWWRDLEGPHWQRLHWQVVAVEPLEGILCVSSMTALGRRDSAPALFLLGRSSAEEVASKAQPLLQAWKVSGVLGPNAELKHALAVPKPLCLLLMHSNLSFVAVSMRRKLPKHIPDSALCARVKSHAERVADGAPPQPRPDSASSELTSGAFRNLVHAMDGWATLLAAATAGSPERRAEVSQELSMMRGWASRLAYQLDPVYLASTRVQTSRLQKGVLGQGARLRLRAWAPRQVLRHRSAKMLTAIRSKPKQQQQQQQQLTGRYTGWFAIQAVLFSSFLRDAAKLQSALKQGIMMAFPQCIANDLLQMLEQSPMPHAATLSRWRVLFEAAACLQLRSRLAKCFQCRELPQPASVPIAMHVLVDSSPQGGRDWLLSEVHMLGHRVPLQRMLLLFWKVCELHPRGGDDLDEDLCQELVAAEQELADAVEVLVLPPAGLGHQRSNLHHKLHGLLHSFWLAAGACLPQVVQAVSSFTSDFGTEAGLPGMEVSSELVCPQLGCSQFCETDGPGQLSDPWPLLSFARSLAVPGIHHVMHNMCEDMCEALPSFRKHKPHFQAMSVFLCDHHVRQGLQERCFGQGDAAAHRAKFASFGERLLDWRWQSVSSFLSAMEPLELPLRQFWSLRAFSGKFRNDSLSGEPAQEAAGPDDPAQAADALVPVGPQESSESSKVLADAVRGKVRSQNFDSAVQNAEVWQYMSMLRKLFAISDELLVWFQSCPCHPREAAAQDDEDRCKHYAACPMKGRRAPELAAGFVVSFMRDQLQGAADVFPSNSDLFTEYVAGLQHFSFMLQLKFANWTAMPHSFLALAHPSETTARAACRRLLGEWEFMSKPDKASAHPLCHAFMSDSNVRDSLVRFGQGSPRDSDDCFQLRAVLGPIAFLPLLERSIEGRHAVVKRATETAPNHRGAYVANVLRSAAIMDNAAQDPKTLVELAEHFDRLRLPVFVLEHLGLKSNASVTALDSLSKKQADKQLQSFGFVDRVMFRLDAATQFADWEDVLDAKQTHGQAKSASKLPLTIADTNSLQRHLALEHFRVTATSSCDFFAATLQDAAAGMPANEFPFRQLQCTLAGNARFADACLDDAGQVALIEADPCDRGQDHSAAVASTWGSHMCDEQSVVADERFRRCVLFKVQSWRPSLLKQVKGSCMTTLTSSDVAVTMFPVVGCDVKPDANVLYTTGKPQGSEGSLAAASAIINDALFQHSVFRFKSSSPVRFAWTGPLILADQASMDRVVTDFMSSDAVAGSGKVLLKPAFRRSRIKSADSSLQILQQMKDRGWAAQDCSAEGWCLTAEALKWVSTRVALTHPVSVLQPRLLDDRGQWTRYEIMACLRDAGWVALQLPTHKKRKGLEMQIRLPDGPAEEASASEDGSRPGKTWYFKKKVPVVSRHYLRAMLAIHENRDALIALGLQRIFHLASVKYFQCLLQVASGEASLQALTDLEPKETSRAVARDRLFLASEPGPAQPRPIPAVVGAPELPGDQDQDDRDSVLSEDPPFLEPGHAVEVESPLVGERDHQAIDEALAILNEEPSDVGAAQAAVPERPERPQPADELLARRRQDKTHRWGAFLITHKIQKQGKAKPVQSWQATCPHPAHTLGNKKCTKTMSFNPDDEAQEMTTLWRVRHWCNSVFLFEDKVSHQAYHPVLEELPDEATMIACRVDSISAEPSDPRMSCKRQRVMIRDRAGSTIGDLYDWPSKLAAKLHRIPRLRYGWKAHLANGNCMVIYSDHSGCGNGEEGLLDAITALKEHFHFAEGTDSADLLEPVVHSVCDPDVHAVQALSATSRAKHLFGYVEDFVSKDMMSDIAPFAPTAQATAEERSAFLKNLATEVHHNLSSYFPLDHKVFCRWKQQDVPALAPEACLARATNRRCLEIQVSGTCCYDWSSMNQKALRSHGPSQVSFLWWKEGLKAHQPDLLLRENVMRFHVEHLMDGLEDLYSAFQFTLSPLDIGWPVRRPRRFTALVHRRWHCSASQSDFEFHFGASAAMTGSDLLAMPPNIVEEYFRNKLRQKLCHKEGLLEAADFRRVLTPRQRKMLEEFEELAAKDGGELGEDFLVDLSQTAEWTTVANSAPIWSHKLQRTALPAEHMLLQGVPLLEDKSPWKQFVLDKAVDPCFDSMFLNLSGNAMHRAVIGTWAAYIVGSLSPCASPSSFRFRSTSELTITGDEQLEGLLAAADAFGNAASTGRRAKSKAKAKAKASGEARVLGVPAPKKAPGRETYRGLKCMICQCEDCTGKNPYCQKCKADVDSLAKTAKDDGWVEKYEDAKRNERTFRKLVRDYQLECPSKGKGRARVQYSKSRALEIIANEQISDEGTRMAKMDWFDFEAFYSQKKLSPEDIETKWRTRLAAEGAYDLEGENRAFPERLLVRKEDYVDSKARRRVSHQLVNEASPKVAKESFLEDTADDRPANFFSSEANKFFEARPKRRGSTGSNASAGSLSSAPAAAADEENGEKEKLVGGDLTVSRLKAFDETGEQLQKALETLGATIAKVEKEALGSVARVNDIDGEGIVQDYKSIVCERLVLAKLVHDDLSKDDSWSQRDLLLQNALTGQVSPVPNKTLLRSAGSVRDLQKQLKSITSAEDLPKAAEQVKGMVSTWRALAQSVTVAMQEASKAIREVTKKRKRKEKEEENKQKRAAAAEAKALAKQAQPKAPAAKGPTANPDVLVELFGKLSSIEKVTEANGDSFFDDLGPSVSRCVTVNVPTPVEIVGQPFFEARLAIFMSQFPGSSAALNTGRAFMKIGAAESKLGNYYAKLSSTSRPEKLADAHKDFMVPGFVGLVAKKTSFQILDLASFRHSFGDNKLDIVMMSLDSFFVTCKDIDA
ncbi:unnamed protein product, partial [Symbiodinium sp. CCMP2592]